jgi:uncharacterized membrane protein YfcA
LHLDLYIVIGSAIVGLLVGMTGAGGGALMTPMLVLLFGVTPASAISSDLVASVVMRPVGAAVHMRAGTIHKRLVLLLAAGSVPAAVLGSWLLSLLAKGSSNASQHIELALGAALLVGAIAMVLRGMLDRRSGQERDGLIAELEVRPLQTFLIGLIGGLIVGMTSVGAGSLMIVLLLFLYPRISAKQLVGTDLAQAVPLTLAAALGSFLFGHVEFGLTVSLLVGSVPAVFVGALLSSHISDRYIRPVITFVICASGLKYLGLGVRSLAGTMIGVVLVALIVHLVGTRRRAHAAELEDVTERKDATVRTPAPLG